MSGATLLQGPHLRRIRVHAFWQTLTCSWFVLLNPHWHQVQTCLAPHGCRVLTCGGLEVTENSFGRGGKQFYP